MVFDYCYRVGQLCAIDSMSGIIWLIYSAKQYNPEVQSILYAYCLPVVWKHEAYLSFCWLDCGNMIQWWKQLSILRSVFELYLCYQEEHDLAPVIGFVFSVSLEWQGISTQWDLFQCHLHHKAAPFYKSILDIVCLITFLVKNCHRAKKDFIQMWKMASLRFRQYSLCTS